MKVDQEMKETKKDVKKLMDSPNSGYPRAGVGANLLDAQVGWITR